MRPLKTTPGGQLIEIVTFTVAHMSQDRIIRRDPLRWDHPHAGTQTDIFHDIVHIFDKLCTIL